MLAVADQLAQHAARRARQLHMQRVHAQVFQADAADEQQHEADPADQRFLLVFRVRLLPAQSFWSAAVALQTSRRQQTHHHQAEKPKINSNRSDSQAPACGRPGWCTFGTSARSCDQPGSALL
jgi:hypothetical protein